MKIKMMVLDVDGTMTDGKLYIGNDGEVAKSFSVKDGLGIASAIRSGIYFVIITGRTSEIVLKRARELGIHEVHQCVKNKYEKLVDVCAKQNIDMNEVAYMGDDLNDLNIISKCGMSGCPNDAATEIKEVVDYVATKNGGDGAVREFIEFILKKDGTWENIVKSYSLCR